MHSRSERGAVIVFVCWAYVSRFGFVMAWGRVAGCSRAALGVGLGLGSGLGSALEPDVEVKAWFGDSMRVLDFGWG